MLNTIAQRLAWLLLPTLAASSMSYAKDVIHDSEFQVAFVQNAEAWRGENKDLQQKLNALRKKYGRPPNIVHIMWDDTSVGDVGIPAINKIRGFETPNINQLANEGIFFTRMYTENSCTPSRAAVMTGRHAVRSGMTKVSFPIEGQGLAKEEVTIAEVLSKAGYATGFFGKWHLGDVEESYAYNQGFDEAFFTPYNQLLSIYNPPGEMANAVQGVVPALLQPNPYRVDQGVAPTGWIMTIEGKKGAEGREWRGTAPQDYLAIDPEAKKRTLNFIARQNDAEKPFYVAFWPNMLGFLPEPGKKHTLNRGRFAEAFVKNVDPFVGELMEHLKTLGIHENTLVVAMADNGPMIHNPPPGLGMTETIFRGGKDDYWEGGIRVPAFAWWPGTIAPDQIVGDMIHQTDLFTTFAMLGGAQKHIPTDRVIDGIDQSSLLLNGDTHGRRDYNYVYTGNTLAATTKEHIKRVWVGDHGSIASPMYNLYIDIREVAPMLVPMMHYTATFDRMKHRHEVQQKKYPHRVPAKDLPFTGLENARPETQALWNAMT